LKELLLSCSTSNHLKMTNKLLLLLVVVGFCKFIFMD
jgi:hypothetical protein